VQNIFPYFDLGLLGIKDKNLAKFDANEKKLVGYSF
jgi:hypothetical protein